uniref:Elongin-C n=1 Tax=Strigamia maritima TaxID=126957 RepID=T1IQU3_STRMM
MSDSDLDIEKPIADIESDSESQDTSDSNSQDTSNTDSQVEIVNIEKPVAPIEKPFYQYGSFVDEGSDDDCIGSDSLCVKLMSKNKDKFIIRREHAIQSETIKAILSGPGMFAETEMNQVNFREIKSQILEEVCKYLAYKLKHHESDVPIPDFPIHLGIVFDLLKAANFLDC